MLASLQAGSLLATPATIKAGPMVGHVAMREATVWVQLDQAAAVRLAYWPKTRPDAVFYSAISQAESSDFHAVRLLADQVEPGTTYAYAVEIDGQRLDPVHRQRFTTPPYYRDRTPAPDFAVALLGRDYVLDPPFDPPNRTPGGNYRIYNTILEQKPEVVIWTGSTLALREPDWSSRSGLFRRYSHNRAFPEKQALLAAQPHYAVWGTTDYGPPAAQGNLWNRNVSREAFGVFWPNPSQGVTTVPEGITTRFGWSDVDFFLLDDRTFREMESANPRSRRLLGDAQIEWLVSALRQSEATFKVVVCGTPLLHPVDDPGHLTAAPAEREKLLNLLTQHRIQGLIFVAGGQVQGEITRLVRANTYPVFEIKTGPLTARPSDQPDERNFFRVPGSLTPGRQFGILRFTGVEDAREAVYTVYDADGKVLRTQTLRAADLR